MAPWKQLLQLHDLLLEQINLALKQLNFSVMQQQNTTY